MFNVNFRSSQHHLKILPNLPSWRIPLQADPGTAIPAQRLQAACIHTGVSCHHLVLLPFPGGCSVPPPLAGAAPQLPVALVKESMFGSGAPAVKKQSTCRRTVGPRSFVGLGCDKNRRAFNALGPRGANAGRRYVCTFTHSERRK